MDLKSPSCSLSQKKSCPCKAAKQGKTLWIQCSNKNCENRWWHAICAGFTKPKQAVLNSIDDWVCTFCVLQNLKIDTNVNNLDMFGTLSKKMDEMKKELKAEINSQKLSYASALSKGLTENREKAALIVKNSVKQLETNLTTKIEVERETLVEINKDLETVRSSIEKNYETETESEARSKKINNVCIYNIPENSHEDSQENYKNDVKVVKELLTNKINLSKDDVKAFYRVGIKTSGKNRPIIIKLSSVEIKKNILSLRNLQYNGHRVFVSIDRTKKEQIEHKKLVAELKERKIQGEENIIIRDGKIVKNSPFRINPQLFWG